MNTQLFDRAAAIAAALIVSPNLAAACACGCGVFAVGADGLNAPTGRGEIAFEYDHMDQNQDWSSSRRVSADDNPDKEIRTDFFTLMGQYRLSRTWSVRAEVPLWSRTFRTENATGTGVAAYSHSAIGDVRLTATYSGLAKDGSTGLVFGLKLPSGDFHYANFDRDAEIGAGSTDILIGGYRGASLAANGKWSYFVQALGDLPVASQGGYTPGREADGAVGVAYHGLSAVTAKVMIMPTLQMIGSIRGQDSGPDAHPGDSGYERVLISPGLAVMGRDWQVRGDLEIPLYQRFNGHQLAAPILFKVRLSRGF